MCVSVCNVEVELLPEHFIFALKKLLCACFLLGSDPAKHW